jgi:nucleoside-diphosphate-sugar epimerase
VHLAELSNDPLGQLSPHITYAINHQGSVALARLCKAAGVPRFVYTSSCSVYGIGGGSEYKTETSTPQPQTAYAECKVLVERDVSALADATFSPTFLRNATAYGPSPRMRFDLVLNNLAGLAWTTKRIHMTSDGTPWRPLVHVLDICEAIACTLEAPREAIHNEIFNVGKTSENYQVREIAEIVAEVFPGCDLVFGTSDGDNRSYRVSFDKIATHLPANCMPSLNALGCHETSSNPVPILVSNKSSTSVIPVRLMNTSSGNNAWRSMLGRPLYEESLL